MKTDEIADIGAGEALLGDGRVPIALVGIALMVSGGFALFLCLTSSFLPQDVAFLRMNADQLARITNPRLVMFMFHDRAAFGGSLLAVGSLYLWLAGFPLKAGEPWAWWTLAISGTVGFASFLAYLGYGYLDTWHGAATLALLPLFVTGMARAWSRLPAARSWKTWTEATAFVADRSSAKLGRIILIFYGAGLLLAGSTIAGLGMTRVFVSTDLSFIGMSQPAICGVSDRLVPLIAHDRAGFGGGLLAIGLTILGIVLNSPLTRSCRQVLWFSGAAGFASAIGVHFVIGYTNVWHLAPAVAGAALFLVGIVLASIRPPSRVPGKQVAAHVTSA